MVKAVVAETATKIPDSALQAGFKTVRRVSGPIVLVETPDPASTIRQLSKALPDEAPQIQWDAVDGLTALNDPGNEALKSTGVRVDEVPMLAQSLEVMAMLPKSSVVFVHNIQLHIEDALVIQGIWNLRDKFKTNRRTLVLMGPVVDLPIPLQGDVITLSEPLPTREHLGQILDASLAGAKVKIQNDETRRAALDAVVGLASFTAEQVIAMAMRPDGIDVDQLWDHKIQAIEHTPGLRVHRKGKGVSLKDLKGIDNVKSFCERLIAAEAFGAIVFIDEGDKAFAGGMSDYSGDSGVSKDQVGVILSYIEDTRSLGLLACGVAGTGKTALAQAMAEASGKPLIYFDMGGMKGGIVGESERRIRAALKVVTATAEGRVLFIMTANQTASFTPELNRRFRDQFFFDLPDDEGRKAMWPVYIQKSGLKPEQCVMPDDKDWTGDEIRRTCDRAALFNETLTEAAAFTIPQAVSAKAVIAKQRMDASGRFLSASSKGIYTLPEEPKTYTKKVEEPTARAISFGKES
jgi:hypothetical protein